MSAERIAELKARLTKIDAAREELAFGSKAVKLAFDGHQVEYTPSSLPALDDLESRTRAELRQLNVARGGGVARLSY